MKTNTATAALAATSAAAMPPVRRRPTVPAMLAASAAQDQAEIAALPVGGVWTKMLVNASDLLAMEEADESVRIYVERVATPGYLITYRLEVQDSDWTWEYVDPAEGEDDFQSDSADAVVRLYPFWAEIAERRLVKIRADHNRTNAGPSMRDYTNDDPRGLLCNHCAFDAGATYADRVTRSVAGRCPICHGSPRWLQEPSYWDGLPSDLVERVQKMAEEAEASRLEAMAEREERVLFQDGPIYLSGSIPSAVGWSSAALRVVVIRKGDGFTIEMQGSSEAEPWTWTATDLGESAGDHDRTYREIAEVEGAPAVIAYYIQKAKDECAEYREKYGEEAEFYGITDESLRAQWDATRARLDGAERVGA